MRLREDYLAQGHVGRRDVIECLTAWSNVLGFFIITAETLGSRHICLSYRDAIPSLAHLQHRGLELTDEVMASITVIVVAHNLGWVQHGHPRAVPRRCSQPVSISAHFVSIV